MAQERLQKIIAAAGITSRRKAEELIASGAVTLNGKVVTELGTKADLATDHIKVNGKLLQQTQELIHLVLHKPKGYVSTVSDPEGRPTVMELVSGVGVRGTQTRIYPVGRLDYASEGLLLFTNDGELAHKLTHASSHVPKTYWVKVSGNPSDEGLQQLCDGVMIPEGEDGKSRRVRTAPCHITQVKEAENPWYEITLIEGKNRQLRKMFEVIGHRVEKIKRVRYGPLQLDIEVGKFRMLTEREVGLLRAAASGKNPPPASARLNRKKLGIGKKKELKRPSTHKVAGKKPKR